MGRILSIFLLFCLKAHSLEPLHLLILEAQPTAPYAQVTETILSELQKHGLFQNQNLIVDRHVLGNYEGRGISTLRALKDANFHVILLNGTIAGLAAKKFMNQLPRSSQQAFQFVYVNITDPVGIGLVDSLQAPTSGAFTGISYPVKIAERLRLVQKYFGKNARVGYIYSEMPQSLSYKGWLDEQLKLPEFQSLNFVFRKIPFIHSDGGVERMAMIAETHIQEMDSLVDVFLSPNDQLGVSNAFGSRILRFSSKPLVGLADEMGCAIAVTPDLEKMGKDAAMMILGIYRGKKSKDFIPVNSSPKLYRNKSITLPDPILEK